MYQAIEACAGQIVRWSRWRSSNHHRLLEPLGYIPPAEAEANDYRQLSQQATPA
jgi:putative transposase